MLLHGEGINRVHGPFATHSDACEREIDVDGHHHARELAVPGKAMVTLLLIALPTCPSLAVGNSHSSIFLPFLLGPGGSSSCRRIKRPGGCAPGHASCRPRPRPDERQRRSRFTRKMETPMPRAGHKKKSAFVCVAKP